jgi:hypothetical protein
MHAGQSERILPRINSIFEKTGLASRFWRYFAPFNAGFGSSDGAGTSAPGKTKSRTKSGTKSGHNSSPATANDQFCYSPTTCRSEARGDKSQTSR